MRVHSIIRVHTRPMVAIKNTTPAIHQASFVATNNPADLKHILGALAILRAPNFTTPQIPSTFLAAIKKFFLLPPWRHPTIVRRFFETTVIDILYMIKHLHILYITLMRHRLSP